MLNQHQAIGAAPISVIDYQSEAVERAMRNGRINTAEDQIAANIRSSIRRGYPQMRQGPLRSERICLVGSGPSLAQTEDELRQAIWEGAILVTLNGAYHWCIEQGFLPKTQIVMDARPTNARFVTPAVPNCRYVLASQCAPETWDAVAGRKDVWIFHAVMQQEAASEELNAYYGGQWMGVGGGTTVATRAINMLRMAGYVRFELFGIDCCRMGETHHAMPQPENDRDRYSTVRLGIGGDEREFSVSPWHAKQFEDFLVMLKINGQHFLLNVHGDGMLAHAMRMLGRDVDLDALSLKET